MHTIEARRSIPRAFNAPMRGYDLQSLITQLKHEKTWKMEQRNAITLAKGPEMRVVLILTHAKSSIPPHRVFGPLTVQVVEGMLRIHINSEPIEVRTGQMLSLQPEIRHSIESVEESAFLLSLTTGPSHPAIDFGY
jgi:quercetin dioxygenase-like cupin family protein